MDKEIYLDYHRVRPPLKGLDKEVQPFLMDHWRELGSTQGESRFAEQAAEKARAEIYQLCGLDESVANFFLTSSGQESVSQVFLATYLDFSRRSGKTHFLVAQDSEAAALMASERLVEFGGVTQQVKVDSSGLIDVDAVADEITPRTALLSLSWANGLTGVFQALEEIGELCRERGILFHIDATHVLGGIRCNFEEVGADFLTFSGEQLGAGRGIGGLFIKKGVSLGPTIMGGGQELKGRGGEVNLPALVALGFAAEVVLSERDFVSTEVARLRHKFEKKLQEGCPDISVVYSDSFRLPDVSSISFRGVASDAMLHGLREKGVIASFGGGQQQHLPQMLLASGVEPLIAQSALSFSFGSATTEEEVDHAVDLVLESFYSLRKHSMALI